MGAGYSGTRRVRSSSAQEDLQLWKKHARDYHRHHSLEVAKTPQIFRDVRRGDDRVVLYTVASSHNGLRVELTLLEKEVPYDKKTVDIMKGSHKSPEYTSINPRQKIPSLIHDDVVINESCAAMEYVNAVFNKDIRLRPKDPVKLGKCLQYIHEFEVNLDPKNISDEVLHQGKTRDELQEEIKILRAELMIWEGYLANRDYLVDDFSLADIAVFPLIAQLTECLGLDLSEYPNMGRWYRNMRGRNSLKDHPYFTECLKADDALLHTAHRRVLSKEA